MKQSLTSIALLILINWSSFAQVAIKLDPSYDHDRWSAKCNGIEKQFRAYCSCFDDLDDDNGDGINDAWGVPELVSYQIKRIDEKCIKTDKRPTSGWFGYDDLYNQGIMPKDESYTYPKPFRNIRKDWFIRGHLAMKLHAERMGHDAAYNTHTFFNCVPQRSNFNGGIWLDLENHTAAWAQRYGTVWIMTGPIFMDKTPVSYIGEDGEFKVAVPEALFKIVVREDEDGMLHTLAFIYPQVGPTYTLKDYDHTRFLTSIEEIESLTGMMFFPDLSKRKRKLLVESIAPEIWPSEKKDFIHACKKEKK
jgi:endonuclease G, mitochondrial